jgi:hypothetical protein
MFPLAWAPEAEGVPGVDVTEVYLETAPPEPTPAAVADAFEAVAVADGLKAVAGDLSQGVEQ